MKSIISILFTAVSKAYLVLTIILLLVSFAASANSNKQATVKSDRFTPISVRTYYLETSTDVCSYSDFVKSYRANEVQAVKGYKLINGIFLKSFSTVYELTTKRPTATKDAKGQKRVCY